MRHALLALAVALSLGAPAALAHGDEHEHGGNISKVNGGITAESGHEYRDLDKRSTERQPKCCARRPPFFAYQIAERG